MNRKWICLLLLGAAIGAAVLALWRLAQRLPHIPSQPASPGGDADPDRTGADVLHFRFDGVTDADGVPAPWQPKVSSGRLQVEVRSREGAPDQKVLWVRSQGASYFLANAAHPFDPAEYPYLSWSWKALVLPTDGDVRKNSLLFGPNRNDQALQVLVAFEGGAVLSYVWDTTAPVGAEVDEPSLVAAVKTTVVDSGATHANEWREHKVNIYDDYQRRFGKPPARVVGVLAQTNSNHTGSVSEGVFGEMTASRR
jgi:hypothetical protein